MSEQAKDSSISPEKGNQKSNQGTFLTEEHEPTSMPTKSGGTRWRSRHQHTRPTISEQESGQVNYEGLVNISDVGRAIERYKEKGLTAVEAAEQATKDIQDKLAAKRKAQGNEPQQPELEGLESPEES